MGSAFPVISAIDQVNAAGRHCVHVSGGLTKRELFAAMAMQGMLANPETDKECIQRASSGEGEGQPDVVLAHSARSAFSITSLSVPQ